MRASIFVALKDSVTSRSVVDYVAALPLDREEVSLTLLHVLRKPSQSESLMDENSVEDERRRSQEFLDSARADLVGNGFRREDIQVKVVETPHSTSTEGIIEQCSAGDCDLLIIGRRRMSKAQEFVMGDISINLVRSMQDVGILVVESR